MRKRRVILLGSTGSIGASAIKVAETMPDRMEIVGMAAKCSSASLAEAANRLKPAALCIVDPGSLDELRRAAGVPALAKEVVMKSSMIASMRRANSIM